MGPPRGPRPPSTPSQGAMAHRHYETPENRANPPGPPLSIRGEQNTAPHAGSRGLAHTGRPVPPGPGGLPLRGPRPRSTQWQVAMAHGHYEPPETRANPLRPSWIFSDEEITATGADYLALGHWDRPMRVGSGVVPAFYSGSPELARTVNLVRLTTA